MSVPGSTNSQRNVVFADGIRTPLDRTVTSDAVTGKRFLAPVVANV